MAHFYWDGRMEFTNSQTAKLSSIHLLGLRTASRLIGCSAIETAVCGSERQAQTGDFFTYIKEERMHSRQAMACLARLFTQFLRIVKAVFGYLQLMASIGFVSSRWSRLQSNRVCREPSS